jgi:tetratricopeptide (TPR) repeat protein
MSYDKKIKALEKKLATARFSYPDGWYKVISTANKLLKYLPNHPEAHFEKGSALHHLDKYKEAIESFDKAINAIFITKELKS